MTKAWSKWRYLTGVICDKKVPTKMKLLIYQTVIRPTLLYGCETWPMSVKDEKLMATIEMIMVRWAMGVSLLERRRNKDVFWGSNGGIDNSYGCEKVNVGKQKTSEQLRK